ncbi:MerR family transcriptional regulator [Pseudoflavonifractor phocaeensis]|uniref:MerR family transcriptional regulator n=1 Tax=Pseudoflavonifractor phocaeensis TaxID=1870988 RepID=UPI001F1D98D9|nr:MerR family transcriptional regulator [Pseudoflavonifractor phocaeensis]MCF2662050.1 MerR family transcriptional regulator [Pseudoflavonifractor phocaeensis]
MKINEVEAQVGITKKNIRFYEEQGLLSPRRNSENGYRDYGPEEVAVLRQIKLLRKLGVPLEEIRRMQAGSSTVADGMRRHLVTLERERRNLEQSMELCRGLKDREVRLADLDAAALLAEMEELERSGTTFLNKQVGDRKPIRYVAPVVVTVLMTALMAAVMALMLWAFARNPAGAPPLPLMVVLVAIPAAVILGVVLALVQRVREIGKGEIDDAKNY